jgi:hypothetical protein
MRILFRAHSTVRIIALIVGFFVVNITGQDNAKPKPEEIITKHIASIGTAEAIASAANRKSEGTAQARRVQSTFMTVTGKSFLASTKDKNLLLMMFEASSDDDYKTERIAFDGNKLNIPFVTASSRSAIGSFTFEYPEIVKQGLLGGALFSTWALFDKGNKISKFEYQGKEKIGDIETYKVKLVPKGGSVLSIKLYFDAQSFRHVRTEYQRTITAGTVAVDEGRITEPRYKLIEDFSDFQQISGVNLPTTYKITFRVDTAQRGREFEWLMKFSRFVFDQQIPADVFQ